MARKSRTEEHLSELDEVSKSQIKRNMIDLQKLGEKLFPISQAVLEKVISDQVLLQALIQSKTISSNIAKKRQGKYVGKLLSKITEEELDAINELVDNREGSSLKSNQHFHLLEKWRDKLLTKQDEAINELLTIHPQFDRTQLRQLVRNAQQEQVKNKPPKSARLIFKYLKEQIPLV